MTDTEEGAAQPPEHLRRVNYRVVRPEDYRTDDPDPGLAGNLMALTFPAPATDENIALALMSRPRRRPKGFKTWPLEVRKEYLEFLDEFHHVFQVEIHLVHKVVALIRKSFRTRDPRNPEVMNVLLQGSRGREVKLRRQTESGGGGGLGILFTGPTGTGKTSFLDRLVAYIGGYGRHHQQLGGQPAHWPQLGAIRVAAQDTWKETLRLILGEVDRQVGKPLHMPRSRQATEAELRAAVNAALTNGFAPILIIDEIQRLNRLKTDAAVQILNGLIDLMGEWGVPVLIVGTEGVAYLLERFAAEMDKFSNGGTFEFRTLEASDPDTVEFIQELKRQNISQTAVTFSEDFEFQLTTYTMGIKRIMREYMKALLARHAEDETLEINEALLAAVSQQEMKRFERALTVLRKYRLGMKLSYEDSVRYNDYLPDDSRAQTIQSKAQVLVEAQWRMKTRSSKDDADQPEISARQFLELLGGLKEAEASGGELPEAQRVENPEPKKARGSAANKAKAAVAKAKEQIDDAVNKPRLGQMKAPEEPRQDAVRGEDIR